MNDYAIAFFNQIGWKEIVLILAVALLLFGGKKLPELARGLARGLREFKDELSGVKKEIEKSPEEKEDDGDDKEGSHS